MLAADIGRTVQFHRLGAGQLLKHILGLAWTTNATPRLLYIYYDSRCAEASEHQAELNRFRTMIDSSIDFRSLWKRFAHRMAHHKNMPKLATCDW